MMKMGTAETEAVNMFIVIGTIWGKTYNKYFQGTYSSTNSHAEQFKRRETEENTEEFGGARQGDITTEIYRKSIEDIIWT